jgi:hypothetical protein
VAQKLPESYMLSQGRVRVWIVDEDKEL